MNEIENPTSKTNLNMMETNIANFKQSVSKVKTARDIKTGETYDYLEGLEMVRILLSEEVERKNKIARREVDHSEDNIKRDKAYLRRTLEERRQMIESIVFNREINIRGYSGKGEEPGIYDFIEEAAHDIAGYSVLADAFADPDVSDIFIQSWDNIYVEKNGVNTEYHKLFHSKEHYELIAKRFVATAKKEVNNGDKKIVDFELYGDRGVIIADSISPRDYTIALRKHAEDQITMQNVIDGNVMTADIAELLGYIIEGESNLIYAGITGTGKTTTLRALLDYSVQRLNKRMLVVEDTQELFPKNRHTVELVSHKHEDKSLAVPLEDLIITALRMKPKYIVVGEVRGVEAQAAVEAMETGHSTIFSMHGGDSWNIVNRLVTKYLMAMPSLGIDVVERIIGSAVDYICIQDNIPNVGRRMTSMVEVSYDFNTGRIAMKPIVDFNVVNNEFIIRNKLAPEKVKNMLRRGLKWEHIEKWTDATLEELYNLEVKTDIEKDSSNSEIEEKETTIVKDEKTKKVKNTQNSQNNSTFEKEEILNNEKSKVVLVEEEPNLDIDRKSSQTEIQIDTEQQNNKKDNMIEMIDEEIPLPNNVNTNEIEEEILNLDDVVLVNENSSKTNEEEVIYIDDLDELDDLDLNEFEVIVIEEDE